MSILNAVLEAAAKLSAITNDELAAWRKQVMEETGNDDLKLIRERQLASSTMSSTLLGQQITKSEQHLDKLIDKVVPAIKALLPQSFAIEEKQWHLDRLRLEAADKRSAALARESNGLH